MIIFSAAYGIYITTGSVSDFYKYDVITNTERKTEKSFSFPAITICVHNCFLKDENGGEVAVHDSDLKTFVISSSYSTEINGNASVIDVKEQLEFFNEPLHGKKCLRFNGSVIENTSITTKSNLFFKILMKQYFMNRDMILFKDYAIFITESNLYSLFNSQPLTLNENEYYEITTERESIETKLVAPYNNCTNENKPQLNCIEKCIKNQLFLERNCSIPSYFEVKGIKRCVDPLYGLNKYMIDKEYLWKLDLNSSKERRNLIAKYYTNCEDKCQKECTSSKFSTPKIIKQHKLPTNDTFTLKVMLSDLSSLHITQIPKMSLFDVISSISGTINLFIGISFVSIVEILEFIIDVLFAFFSLKNKK